MLSTHRRSATRRSPLLSKWPIRKKLLFGIGLLLVIVAALSISGFLGVYAYRSLARSLRGRADELPVAGDLARGVSDLRVIIGEVRSVRNVSRMGQFSTLLPLDRDSTAWRFEAGLRDVRETLELYRKHLAELAKDNPNASRINDSSREQETVRKIEVSLERISDAAIDGEWLSYDPKLDVIEMEVEHLQGLTWELPSYLHRRMHDFADEARVQYRVLILFTWITTILAAMLLLLFIRLFYSWVFRPLRKLVQGSRRVAAGEFGYRILLDSQDEMRELADAMNDMTARFEAIRDDLDRQVRERTKQVVRSEHMASVGFLAAGVAHEINNPLQSIAVCGESLEARLSEALDESAGVPDEDRKVMLDYVRMIQSEAFRCAGITERLLDFSRASDVTRQHIELGELVRGVIDMVGHLGRYQDLRIEFEPVEAVFAPVNPQELKQVVLNLITNGLDSLLPGGRLLIELQKTCDNAQIIFTVNGCGMTDEVLQHLFEPFFTRRRNGQGTGLGLSITYRIVADHGGQIDVHSDGPGKGSRFCVSLPLAEKQKEPDHRYQAA
jgi:signal transduction histidine kinase